jgi:hypothetical protein
MPLARCNVEKTITRPFSLKIYLLIVFALSWPFQITFLFLGEEFRPMLLVSMVMAGVGTLIAGGIYSRTDLPVLSPGSGIYRLLW